MAKNLIFLLLAAIFIMALIPGCSLTAAAGNVVTVSGTWDIISPFQRKVVPAYNPAGGTEIRPEYSPQAIEQVKKGKSDIAITGLEPSDNDLRGLRDHVIAFDAVCIIIDANSFQGGEYWQGLTPVRQTTGFQNLTSGDLKGIFANYATPFGWRWEWHYKSWKPLSYDLDTATYSAFKTWMPDYKQIFPDFKFLPGRYDTQTLIYQKLGLNENEISQVWNNQFTGSKLNSEEEALAIEYPKGNPFDAGSGDFTYQLGFVSRRVMPVALQHVPIKAVSVNGINPLKDSQAIYDGKYPFSRKIHLITRESPPPATTQFVDFLLSSNGQRTIKDTGYLPLP